MNRRLIAFGVVLAALCMGAGLFFAPHAHAANGVPTNVYPDPADTCNWWWNGSACAPGNLYLSVGFGEHTSGSTSVEIYPAAAGLVTVNIGNAGICPTPINPAPATFDFDTSGSAATTYAIYNKTSGVLVAGPISSPYGDCGLDSISFAVVNPADTFELLANVPAGGNRENQFQLNAVNATLGAGNVTTGGLSLANRNLPYPPPGNQSSFSTYAMYFATDCSSGAFGPVQIFDDDYLNFQSTAFYGDLTINLLERVRGQSASPWVTVYSGISTGGDAVLYNIPYSILKSKEYRLEIVGLSRPNALEIDLPANVSQRNVGTTCNNLPTGTISASCVSVFPVAATVTFTGTVSDPDGGDVSATISTSSGIVHSFVVPAGAPNYSEAVATSATGLVVTATLQITDPQTGTVITVPSTSYSCVVPPPPTFTPYFKVTAGDVSAGAGFEAAGTCTQDALAPIAGFNRGTAPFDGNDGAGTQLGAFDLGTVYGFTTGQSPGRATPKSLTFANTGAGAASSAYGGGFGAVSCMTNYFATRPATAAWVPGTFSTGNFSTSGPVVLPAAVLGSGVRMALYVTGDVYINGNITFGGQPWASTANIPGFYLVVQNGNIYIDKGVTKLDGVYVAQPDAAAVTDATKKGKIYTCANGGLFSAPSNGEIASLAICGANRLVVNGAFIARQVKLTRSIGDLGGISAEEFDFTPDTWLGAPTVITPPSSTGYDSITTLPPLL